MDLHIVFYKQFKGIPQVESLFPFLYHHTLRVFCLLFPTFSLLNFASAFLPTVTHFHHFSFFDVFGSGSRVAAFRIFVSGPETFHKVTSRNYLCGILAGGCEQVWLAETLAPIWAK